MSYTAACGEVGVLQSNYPLDITLTADKVDGDVTTEFSFRADATGNSFQQFVLTFGDSSQFVSPLSQLGGATRVGFTVKHTYAAAGTYHVVGTIEELFTARTASRALDVIVR